MFWHLKLPHFHRTPHRNHTPRPRSRRHRRHIRRNILHLHNRPHSRPLDHPQISHSRWAAISAPWAKRMSGTASPPIALHRKKMHLASKSLSSLILDAKSSAVLILGKHYFGFKIALEQLSGSFKEPAPF